MKRIRQLVHIFNFTLGSILFFAGSAVFNALCFITLIFGERATLQKALRSTLHQLFRLWFWFLRTFNLVHLDTEDRHVLATSRGVIYVANHTSLLDAPILFSLIPDAICIYKERLKDHPFYSAITRSVGFLPNTGGPDMIRNAAAALRAGSNLLIFPEGTRSPVVHTDTWKGGFVLISKRSQAPIRSIWIDSPPRFLNKSVALVESRHALPATFGVAVFDEHKVPARVRTDDAMNEIARNFEARQKFARA